jgi:hypothetical protein
MARLGEQWLPRTTVPSTKIHVPTVWNTAAVTLLRGCIANLSLRAGSSMPVLRAGAEERMQTRLSLAGKNDADQQLPDPCTKSGSI